MIFINVLEFGRMTRGLYKLARAYARSAGFSAEDIERHKSSEGKLWLDSAVEQLNTIERKIYDNIIWAMHNLVRTRGSVRDLSLAGDMVDKILEQDLKKLAYIVIISMYQVEL